MVTVYKRCSNLMFRHLRISGEAGTYVHNKEAVSQVVYGHLEQLRQQVLHHVLEHGVMAVEPVSQVLSHQQGIQPISQLRARDIGHVFLIDFKLSTLIITRQRTIQMSSLAYSARLSTNLHHKPILTSKYISSNN